MSKKQPDNSRPLSYVPSTFSVMDSIFEHCSQYLDISVTGFIDISSGKGKALIAASRQPFRSITGIEYAESLHNISVINLSRLGLTNRVTLLHADATTHQWGGENKLYYFFNPFTGAVLHQCLDSIKQNSTGKNIIAYLNPTEDEVFWRYLNKLDEKKFAPGDTEANFYSS